MKLFQTTILIALTSIAFCEDAIKNPEGIVPVPTRIKANMQFGSSIYNEFLKKSEVIIHYESGESQIGNIGFLRIITLPKIKGTEIARWNGVAPDRAILTLEQLVEKASNSIEKHLVLKQIVITPCHFDPLRKFAQITFCPKDQIGNTPHDVTVYYLLNGDKLELQMREISLEDALGLSERGIDR